ncbi:MAG: TVP38/TMEM64 family protein [Solirubrobacterales bacterium]|nr:TVP38/TMEM64 family protein [Solirubrobacterales bacterium]
MIGGLESWVDSAGAFAPLAFILAYVVLTMLLFPGSIATVASGALFGPVWGSVLTVIGATIGATAAYLIAQHLGRDRVHASLGPRLLRFDESLTRTGFISVLILRLLPIAPFNVSNYALGVTGIELRPYVLATAIGIVPGTVAYVALGSTIRDPTSIGFILSVAAVLVLTAIAYLLNRRNSRQEGGEEQASGVT